ncbi:S-adenosyl-L-methionine-dependent methyltransferase [Phycomyces nitens]|nr:S-adenosyl-L-methionine-dependent methyltransferase [Phycomyces nitens]
MGNQASKVIDKSKEKRKRTTKRRQSTITLSARSTVSHQSLQSHGNYDWLEESQDTALSARMIHVAMAKAAAAGQSPSNPPTSTPPGTRRKSITEFFTRRKQSISRPTQFSENEFREHDRLQRQHYLLKSARKSNHWATLDEPAVILDMGTGNGIWALEMASQFPQAQVLGMDLRPPHEQQGGPKNLRYVEADIKQSWPMGDNSIDFIFQRNMGQVIQKDQWGHVLGEMRRVLKPGGYIELVESDLWHHNPGPVQQAFDEFFEGQCADLGLDFMFTDRLKDQIEEIGGFGSVDLRALDIPAGEWPQEAELKQFGFINKETQKAFLRNCKSFYVSKWGITADDYDLAVGEVLEEFEEYHGFTRFNCWIAQKS